MRGVEAALGEQPRQRAVERRRQPARLDRLAQRERGAAQRPRARRRRVAAARARAARSRSAAGPSWSGRRSASTVSSARCARRGKQLVQDQARAVERCTRRLGGADQDPHRGHVGSMCGLRPPITAAVVTPLLPDPPVTGGQKRTLRLLEAMERAGLRPHLLTADPGEPGAAERLRARGWEVDVIARAAAGRCWRGCASTPSRLPSPLLHQLAGPLRGGGVARGAGPVRAHPERVLRGARPAFRACSACTTSTPRSRAARRASARGLAWLREHNRAAALRVVERRVLPLADRVLCVSEDDADGRLRRRRARAAGAQRRRRRVLPDAAERRRRARAVLRALRLRGQPARRRALPRRGLAGRCCTCARARGWRSPGGGMDEALRARLAAVEGVEVLGPGRRPAGRAGRRAGGGRPDLGGRRHAAEGARGAGRGARRWWRRRSGASGVGFEDGRHGLLGERPAELAAALAVAAGRPATGRARWAPRAVCSPSATAGPRRSQEPRRCTRRSSRVSARTTDC